MVRQPTEAAMQVVTVPFGQTPVRLGLARESDSLRVIETRSVDNFIAAHDFHGYVGMAFYFSSPILRKLKTQANRKWQSGQLKRPGIIRNDRNRVTIFTRRCNLSKNGYFPKAIWTNPVILNKHYYSDWMSLFRTKFTTRKIIYLTTTPENKRILGVK